jgi:hypothetical protein
LGKEAASEINELSQLSARSKQLFVERSMTTSHTKTKPKDLLPDPQSNPTIQPPILP